MKQTMMRIVLLMGAFLLMAGNAWALPMADDVIKIAAGDYQEGFGGEFKITIENSNKPGTIGDAYIAFCVERDEYIGLGNSYYVESVEDYATNGGVDSDGSDDINNQDPLSDQSKWLYATYLSGGFGTRSFSLAGQVQNAIWYQEDEIGNNSDWISLSTGISDFTLTGWDIKVVNLINSNGGDVQSQIVGAPVPEPATMLLFGTGLVGIAAIGRKRKKFIG